MAQNETVRLSTARVAPRAAGVRAPRQRRSAETLARILATAEELLTRDGPGAITVSRVTKHAPCSVGSFYARFDDRDALVRTLEERFWDRVDQRWNQLFDQERRQAAEPSSSVARIVRALVGMMSADRERLRAFLTLALASSGPGARNRIAALDDRIVRGATRLLLEGRRDEVDVRLVEAWQAMRFVLATARDRVLFRHAAASEQRETILFLVRVASRPLGISDVPDSYADLLERCRVPDRAPSRPS